MTPKTSASLSRRDFVALSALTPVALALAGSVARAAQAPVAPTPIPTNPKIRIGLELYSVRNTLMRDLASTLTAVAKMGYETVEFYAPYRDWTLPYAKNVKSLMDDLGLRCLSTHNPLTSITPGESMTKAIELNQILGSRYIVVASSPKDTNTVDAWKKLCDAFTKGSEQLTPHGLAAGFHNHAGEWRTIEGGQRAMEIIAANTPKEFLLQLDVGTAVSAGVDPVAWIKANPGRIRSIHLKDWAPGEKKQEKEYRVLFGEGTSPWKDIFAAAESAGSGLEFYLIEQEGSRFAELDTVERCLANLRRMRGTA